MEIGRNQKQGKDGGMEERDRVENYGLENYGVSEWWRVAVNTKK